VVNWPLSRKVLSVVGNIYARLLLGIPLRDITAGYRLFRRTTLQTIDLASVESAGYIFQTDLAFRTLRAGLTVVEVPIEFVERVRGQSKMSPDLAIESLRRITAWGLRERGRQLRDVLSRVSRGGPGR
jgi:dolichol-phosphate mannosyltransferase